jgi:3-mercaptopyruvate sulfurtransferase SseA
MARTKSRSQRRKPVWPVLLMLAGGLLIVGAIVWTVYTAVEPTPTTAPQPAVGLEDNYPDVPRVSVTDAAAAYETGSAVFVDVRDAASYASSHVAGALNLPVAEVQQRMGELNQSDWIITYCT